MNPIPICQGFVFRVLAQSASDKVFIATLEKNIQHKS